MPPFLPAAESRLALVVWRSKASLVLIEGYSFGSTTASYQLGELGGVVRVALFELSIPFIEIPPAKLKTFATGKGNAPKDQVLIQAVKRSRIEFANNDEADVLLLWAMAMGAASKPVIEVPAANRKVFSTIDWPFRAAAA